MGTPIIFMGDTSASIYLLHVFLVHQQPVGNTLWGLIWWAFTLKSLAESPLFQEILSLSGLQTSGILFWNNQNSWYFEIIRIRDIFKSKCASIETSSKRTPVVGVSEKLWIKMWWRRYPLMINYMGSPFYHSEENYVPIPQNNFAVCLWGRLSDE